MAVSIIKDLRPTFDVDGYYNGAVQNRYTHQTPFIAGYNLNTVKWTTTSNRQSELTIIIGWTEGSSGTYPIDGDSFELILAGITYTFTFKTSPDSSGYQLPLRGVLSYDAYRTAIKTAMLLAPAIAGHFTITLDLTFTGGFKAVFQSTDYSDIDTGVDSFHSGLTFGASLYTSPRYLETGKIVINGLEFSNLTPTSDYKLAFNIQEVVKALFGNFNDSYDYDATDIMVYDDNLLLKLTVVLTAILTDETIENTTITAYALRSVHQIGSKDGESMISFDPTVFTTSVYSTQALVKFDGDYTRTVTYQRQQYLKVFKGYPFDLCLLDKLTTDKISYELQFKDGSGVIDSANKTISAAASDKYLKRLIISDGAELITPFDDGISARLVLTTKIAGTPYDTANSIYQFEVDIVDECGIYLKWLNSEGGWSYYLFNKYYKIPMSAKSQGKINKYLDTMIGAIGNQTNIGQNLTTGIKINQRFLSKDEYIQLIEIASSPMVYLYNEAKGTQATSESWLEVIVEDFKDDFRDNKKNIFDISFLFTLPANYTQSL